MKIEIILFDKTSPFFLIDKFMVQGSLALKTIRKKYKLRTQDLADICGCSHRSIENWEQGRKPSKQAMMLLKAWLNEKEKHETA